jgi:hypothetical protein
MAAVVAFDRNGHVGGSTPVWTRVSYCLAPSCRTGSSRDGGQANESARSHDTVLYFLSTVREWQKESKC